MTMRPVYVTLDLADASTNGIANGLTGAGPWDTSDFTAEGPSDGLAHQLGLASTADLSAITITVTGLDADGVEISEAIVGPNNSTAESTLYFASVSAISVSATLGANTLDVGWVDEAASPTIPLEMYLEGDRTSVEVAVTGTADFDIQVTNSDIRASSSPPPAQDDSTWLTDANFDGKTASLISPLSQVARALRLIVNSYSSGAALELQIVTPK